MSTARAAALIATLEPLAGASVVDLGCGWAELLLRIVEHEPTVRGLGIDSNAAALGRAQRNADERDLCERVRFEGGGAAQWPGARGAAEWSSACDGAIVIGSSHAWGGASRALDAVGLLLQPAGRLLLGDAFWEQPPTAAALNALDAAADDFTSLPGLTRLCEERGYRLLHVSTATLDEWDGFESRYCAGAQRWTERHPADPAAANLHAALDQHRDGWLYGYCEVLGFAYLTLVRSEDTPEAH